MKFFSLFAISGFFCSLSLATKSDEKMEHLSTPDSVISEVEERSP